MARGERGPAPTSAVPHGVNVSPDEATLSVSESEGGVVYTFDVAADGSLSGQRVFASGLTSPDGLVIDSAGNVLVATWGSTLEDFSPDGGSWGRISVPREATNCGLVGEDGRTPRISAPGGTTRRRGGAPRGKGLA